MERNGYTCTRSGGSLGIFDIIAVSAKKVIFAQIKANHWPPPAERERILAQPVPQCEHQCVEKHMVRIDDHKGGRGRKRIWNIWDVTSNDETKHRVYAVQED